MTISPQDLEIQHKRTRMAITFLLKYLEYVLDIFVRESAFNLKEARKMFVTVLLKKFSRLEDHLKVDYEHLTQRYSIWKLQSEDVRLEIMQIVSYSSVTTQNFSRWGIILLFSPAAPECKISYEERKRHLIPKYVDVGWALSTISSDEKEIVGLWLDISLWDTLTGSESSGSIYYYFYDGIFWLVKNKGLKRHRTAKTYVYRTDTTFSVDPLLFKGQLLMEIYDTWKLTWLASNQPQ